MRISTPERGARPFRLLVAGPSGGEEIVEADIMLDCTGTYGHPNSLGDACIPAVGERHLDTRIRRTIPDLSAEAADWAGRTVLVVGAGHSAQTAVRDLAALADRDASTAIVWAVRSAEPTWGEVADDPLPERAALVERTRELTGGGDSPVGLETGVGGRGRRRERRPGCGDAAERHQQRGAGRPGPGPDRRSGRQLDLPPASGA